MTQLVHHAHATVRFASRRCRDGLLALAVLSSAAGCTPTGSDVAPAPPERPAAPEGAGQSGTPEVEEAPPAQGAASPGLHDAMRQAALEGNLDRVRQAVEGGAGVDLPDENGRTALMLAAFDGHAEVVRFLLERGAARSRRDFSGRTALMYAASGPNAETVRLLAEGDDDIDRQDAGEGFTALMFAAAEGHAEVVKALLERGANAEIRDVDGDRALEFALQNGHNEVARLLREAGEER